MSVMPLPRTSSFFVSFSLERGAEAPRSYVLAVVHRVPLCRCAARKGGPWRALRVLLDYLGDDPRADGSAALANGEPEALVHGDRLDQLDLHLGVLTRGDELAAL